MTDAITRRVLRIPRWKPAEPIAVVEFPIDPIVPDETGSGWSVWHDAERYPSHAVARAAWLRRNSRHSPLPPGSI